MIKRLDHLRKSCRVQQFIYYADSGSFENICLSQLEVLRGEANASSIFPNTTDVGLSREGIYAELLRNHLPNKCNVGGFVFDEHGNESKQLDIIVNTDTTPRFRPTPGFSKSFSPIEGTLGVV